MPFFFIKEVNMITLNLTAKNTEQEVIKQYLEENASEILADKI